MAHGATSTPRVTDIRPMLAVADLARTVRFYVEKLGFNCCGLHGEPPVWAELERDGRSMMFNAPPADCVRRDVPRSSKDYQIYYISSTDVAGLHAEFASRGVPVGDLRVTLYRMKEFEVRDPDDYWLWFGEPTDEAPTVREGD